MKHLKIGILREEKVPADNRVPLSPEQCKAIQKQYPQVSLVVQPSPLRCIPDSAYLEQGITLQEDLSDCDLLMGVKEVPVTRLIGGKKYLFFSHTIKKQPHNRKLLQAILDKNIHLIDYEVLTDAQGLRVIAFGRWAGVVGAHNGIMAWGKRTGAFDLKQMHKYRTFQQAKEAYAQLPIAQSPMRIVLTGTGRVSNGAAETLDAMGIVKISPREFLQEPFPPYAVYTQLGCKDYVRHRVNGQHFQVQDFYQNPQHFESSFAPYTYRANVMINGIFWDSRAPRFFSLEDLKAEQFSIRTIADISCDIDGSVPCTLFASTIANPVFGYNPYTGKAEAPYTEEVIDLMSIDNLPSELPIDASVSFGEQFINSVLPELLGERNTGMIKRASIAKDGHLGADFEYLSDYVQVSKSFS
jgi:alanine dehydrogenase